MTARAVAEAGPVSYFSVTISSAATASTAKELPGRVVGLELPSDARGTEWYFQASSEPGGTFTRLQPRDSTNALTIVASTRTAAHKALLPATFFTTRYFRIESNSVQGSNIVVKVAYTR